MTFFSQQCKLVINNSVLPILRFLNDKIINYVTIENDGIVSLIRKINPNKASGPAGISVKCYCYMMNLSFYLFK